MKTSNSTLEAKERASFFVDGIPIPKGRPRATARGAYTIMYTPPETKEYEAHVAKTASKHIPKTGMIMGPIIISLTFYLKPPKKYTKKMGTPHVTRPDVDNLSKAILDGLESVLYKNDAQVTTLYAHKCYGDKPRVGVSISELVELIGGKENEK
jgi:Holliday junction resolvase RusA-like endonuclease